MRGEVSGTIAGEGGLLAASFLFGIALMLLYDIFRIIRRVIAHGTVWLAVEDVFYWLICAIGIFAMLYQENDGLLRWFVLAGVALGMLFENAVISPFIVRLFVKILRAWLKFFRKLFCVFAKPAKKVSVFSKKRLKKIKKAIKIGISKQ